MTATKQKSIGWSYPTSPNAQTFGYNSTGCYTVNLGVPGKPARAIKAFTSWDAAKACADMMPNDWSRFTMEKPGHCA